MYNLLYENHVHVSSKTNMYLITSDEFNLIHQFDSTRDSSKYFNFINATHYENQHRNLQSTTLSFITFYKDNNKNSNYSKLKDKTLESLMFPLVVAVYKKL